MLLVHRSRKADAVRHVSPGGELCVASVVVAMLVVALGDALDPALVSELGLEVGIFDLGGEFSVLMMRHWHLIQMLLAGIALAAGITVLQARYRWALWVLRAAQPEPIDKVPIASS